MSLAVCSNVAAAFVVWLDYTLDRANGCLPKAASPAECTINGFTHSNFKRATNLLLARTHSLATAANLLCCELNGTAIKVLLASTRLRCNAVIGP